MATEFFDTAEVALNDGGQSWGNLGLWCEGDSYSEACRRLALELGTMAGLDSSSQVLDVGFGCGDQLLLWLEHFDVASLQGVNLSASQTARAKQRLQQHGQQQHCRHLGQGDVADTDCRPAPDAATPNRILCLDSAYHFPARPGFFAHAASTLSGGGKLCLSDFVLAANYPGGLLELPLRAMLQASRIPRANLLTEAHYTAQLADAGFNHIETRDISREVMLGFSGWWSRYREKARQLPTRSRLKYAGTAGFLHWAYRRDVLRYVIIKAEVAA